MELDKVYKLYQDAVDYDRTNREEAFDDLRFRAGDQWPESVKQQRESDLKPCLTINVTGQYVRRITGDARKSPPSISVSPSEGGDTSLARLREGLIRHIEQNSNASIAYMTALDGAVTCGIGHFRILADYVEGDPFNQEILIKRIMDPLSVVWDPDAEAMSKEDAGYCFVTKVISESAFKKKYPDADLSGFNAADSIDLGEWKPKKDGVRVAEFFQRKELKRKMAIFVDGSRGDVTDGVPEGKLVAYDEEGNGLIRDYVAHEVTRSIISGNQILEEEQTLPGKYIPIVPIIGEEVSTGEMVVRQGIVRAAKDPQRMHNYWESSSAEMVALAPRAPFLATPKMIKPFAAIWDKANQTARSWLPFVPDPDAGTPYPVRATMPEPPAAMWQQSAKAVDSMKAVTGIYDASLGAQGNETSGIAIKARQKEGDTGTFVYPDNLRIGVEYAGRILLDMIPMIYDAPRVVRILGKDGQAEMVRLNQDGGVQMDHAKYDVVVSTGPTYETKRQEAVETLMQVVQSVPAIGEMASDLIVGNLDSPGAEELTERLKLFSQLQLMRVQAQMAQMQGQMQGGGQPNPADMAKAQSEAASAEQKLASARKTSAEADAQEMHNAVAAVSLLPAPPIVGA